MVRSSVGTKLYLGVMAIFLLFAVSFIVFQHDREKRYKIDVLDTRLQDYNERMAEVLAMNRNMTEKAIDAYVKDHYEPDMRVTMIDMKGRVIFDNKYKDYAKLENHLGRDEVRQALRQGSGYDIDRKSSTMGQSYFYSATSFPRQRFIIRTALPYNDSLARTLSTDQHYVWFALIAMVLLTVTLYRFTRRLGMNVMKLRTFASRADHKPTELSGGEKQRVAVARALINNPDVIFADEPSGSLDSHNKEELHRLFFDLRDRFNQTFVIVTHDEGLAAMCDRTLKMRDGRIIDQTTNNQQCDDCQ